MSVVGFDLGTDLCKIAVAHKKKIQMVPNELTKLLTPSLTAFSSKERCFGDVAKTQWTRNYRNTVSQMKRWLGRKANDPKLQQEASFWLPGITTATLPDGRFGINVDTPEGQLLLSPEQILCGLLTKLKKFTSIYVGLKVTDCVIACPSYYDDAQRRALLNAAKLAELKVLRLLEEPTAVALNYGILRNLPENETQRVIFFDFGYAATEVAVVDFVRGKLSVRYKASNPYLGGRDFDRCLYELFRKQWKDKHNTDIDTLPKQKLKLLRACTAIKKLLTGNRDAHWTLDCFHDDHDFVFEIHRYEMEEAAEKLNIYQAMLEPLIEALEATKDDKITIHSCEIIGGSSRIPSVQSKILQCVQTYEPEMKCVSTTLNGDECVSRGCALMCAMLSPNFRVREFQVQDILTWPITISYPTEKENTDKKIIEQIIIQRGNPQPCTAKVMFNKTKNFVFKLQHPTEYKENKDDDVKITYPFKTNLNIGEFNVQLLPLSDKAVQPPKIKLLLDINKHGVVKWPHASLIEYVKPDPPKKEKKKEKKGKKNKKDGKKDKKDGKKEEDKKNDKNESKKDEDNDTDMKNNEATATDKEKASKDDENKAKVEPKKEKETDENENESKDNKNKMDIDNENENENETTENKSDDTNASKEDKNSKENKKKEKKKVARDLVITGNFFNELSTQEFNKMFELEGKFLNVDRIVHETDEAKNDLETYVYGLRDKIDMNHRDYIRDSDREQLSKRLTDMEEWVYQEGDEANKTMFLERLKELRAIGDPMEYRLWEFEHRQQRVNNFKKLIFKYQKWHTTDDEKYAHIGEDKRKEVKQYVNDADAWITNCIIKQDRLKKYETPILKCKDVDQKYRDVYEKCNKIVNTPKPKTPPPPPPKEEEKKEDDKEKEKEKETEENSGDKKENVDANANGDVNVNKNENENNKNENENSEQASQDNDSEMIDKTKNTNQNNKTGVDGMVVE